TPRQTQQQLADLMLKVAQEGELGESLELLGEYADFGLALQTFSGEASLGAALAQVMRLMSDMPAGRRYVIWKRWTLARTDEQYARILLGCTTRDTTPEVFRRQAVWNGVDGGRVEAVRELPDL